MPKTKKKPKARLRMAQKLKTVEERLSQELKIDYIDHDDKGRLFLDLIQERYSYPLNVDDYHFHYFMAAGNEFIGIVECMIADTLDTVFINKALFNQAKQDIALVALGGMLRDAFDNVYINEAHWIKDGEFSVMFNPLLMPEITVRQFVVTPPGQADLDGIELS